MRPTASVSLDGRYPRARITGETRPACYRLSGALTETSAKTEAQEEVLAAPAKACETIGDEVEALLRARAQRSYS